MNITGIIREYCHTQKHDASLYELPDNCTCDQLQEKIRTINPDRVIATGGDGTVRLVAECLQGTQIPLGILPTGSANGMARELDIPSDIEAALGIITTGRLKRIHLVRVNGELCIHLCDIGFNAFVVREFEKSRRRGMFGYIIAAWKVLWRRPSMWADIKTDGQIIRRKAAMIVVANATQYGNGVVINPEGSLEDHCFEVIVVRQVSFSEIFKMRVTHRPYDPRKTELFHTAKLTIRSRRKVHFQIDGEYKGKVNKLQAELLPRALYVISNT